MIIILDKTYQDRLAIVTGGANGIGYMLAETFADNGMVVALIDIRADAAAMAAEQICVTTKGEAFAIAADVSEREELVDVAEQLKSHPAPWGIVWINAGVGVGASLIEGNPRAIEWGFSVNALGSIWTAQAFLPHLFSQTGARHIGITVSSAALAPPTPPLTVYAASKHATMGVAEAIRAEAQIHEVETTILCPGLLNTNIWDAARARPDKFGGVRRADPTIATQWREAVKPDAMRADLVAHINQGGGYLTLLPTDNRMQEIDQRMVDLQNSIKFIQEETE